MYFLETIEGNDGERLASAVLKYLFINSGEFRRLFLNHIEKDFAASEIPSFKNGVICDDEYPADCGMGFIDLVVIADNAVLGIENKLWAGLTCNQPSKYFPTLKRLARERWGIEQACKVLMLVPKQRREEIVNELQRQGILSDTCIVDWQSVMTDLKTLAGEETGEVAVVASVFHEYLERRIANVKINADPTKLLGDVKMGNSFQQDFLNKVWGVFAKAGRIRAGGKGTSDEWYGFYFEIEGQESTKWARPWFGFVRGQSGVRLVVQTRRPTFPIQSSGFTFLGHLGRLEVAFDVSDDSVPRWKSKLQPVFDEFRRQIEAPPTE